MIVVHTGLPGAGKTLCTIAEVKRLSERDKRPVYYSGISDLKLPWIELDDPTQWHTLPQGSIVVIDEAQRVFRPRHQSAAVPEYVAKLETHRHLGIDLYLVTQHPKLLDSNVRRLCGRHVHFVRAFGAQAVTRHEWGEIRDDPQARDDSVRTLVPYPREAFGWYKSAEVHTHRVRVPWRVLMLALLPFVIIALGYVTYRGLMRVADPERVVSNVEGVAQPKDAPGSRGGGGVSAREASPKSTAQWLAEQQPRVPGLAHTAPAYDAVTQAKQAPYPAACVSMGRRCSCYTQQATVLDVPESLCRSIVERGYFVPWEEPVAGVRGRVGPLESHGTRREGGGVVPASGAGVPAPASQQPSIGYPGAMGAPGVQGVVQVGRP